MAQCRSVAVGVRLRGGAVAGNQGELLVASGNRLVMRGGAGCRRRPARTGWDWAELRSKLPALAAAWIPDAGDDLIGPGIAIDETAQLKHGDATACVAPQHAGCTGQVENCVTTVGSPPTSPRAGRRGRTSMCTCRTAGRGTCRGGGPPVSPVTWSSPPSRSSR